MGSYTITQWLLLAAMIIGTFGAAYFYYAFQKRQALQPQTRSDVGGWLLLLIIGLVILSPLAGFGRMESGISAAERQNAELLRIPAWGTFKSANRWLVALTSLLSIYAGLGLAFGRRVAVVWQAIAVLWLIGPVASIVVGLFIPLVIFGRVGYSDDFFAALIASAIVASIWTAYLLRSRRVKATYTS